MQAILSALDRATDFLSAEEQTIASDLVSEGCTIDDIAAAYQDTVARGKPKRGLKYLRNIIREKRDQRLKAEEEKRREAAWLAEDAVIVPPETMPMRELKL